MRRSRLFAVIVACVLGVVFAAAPAMAQCSTGMCPAITSPVNLVMPVEAVPVRAVMLSTPVVMPSRCSSSEFVMPVEIYTVRKVKFKRMHRCSG